MKNLNIFFFDRLKENCEKNISFIEEVAEVLDVNYDAAYRRINNKTNLSLSDAVKLANHFNVSLDSILQPNLSGNKIVVSESQIITNLKEIEFYFNSILNNITPLQNKKDVHIIYSAKDLPLFYFTRDPLFSKFKIYTILYLLNKDFPKKNIHFDSFSLPISLAKAAKLFGDIYYEFDITEVWNDGILDSTINQILYFYEIKLLNYSTALKLLEKLKEFIKKIENDSYSGVRNNNSKSKFELYNSLLLMLNNNVLIKTKQKNILISPYMLVNYFVIEDQKFVNRYMQLIENQENLATLLSKTGVKERLLFFKPKYKAIEKAKQHIELIRQFPI